MEKNHYELISGACKIWKSKFLKRMRIVALLILISITQTFALDAYAQNKRLSLNVKNETIVNILEKIEDQSEFYFMFDASRINVYQKKSVDCENQPIRNILDQLFENTGITYSINDRQVLLTIKEKFDTEQQISISGRVIDSSGASLPGVTVVVKGTTTGTITDTDGNYSLANVPADATLVFSFVGMKTQEISVTGKTNINVTMAEETIGIEEVVAIGYGTMKKRDLTGSVGSIQSKQLEEQGAKVNVLEALQGILPGLNINQSANSASQSSFDIMVRGQNSIKASNSPLIILDGVPYNGGFNEINQNDIQSIEVLKDASSSAIYGARGANGVILITTKKGGKGKPKLSYEGTYGLQEIYSEPDILTAEEYWEFATERVGADYADNFPTVAQNYAEGNYVNWLELATRNGQQQKHTLNVTGGNKNINYFLSGGYTDVKGIALGDNFKQLTVRTNIKVNITDWLEIGTNSQYSYQDNSGITANFSGVFQQNPLINVYDENGDYAVYPWPEQPIIQNPLSNLNILDDDKDRRLFSNNYINIDIPFIKGLSYKLNTGYTYFTNVIGRFWGSNTLIGLTNDGQAYTRNLEETDILIENILNYQHDFGDHNINITGLYSTQKNTSENRKMTSSRFPTETLTWYQPDVAEVIEPSASFTEQNYISQMARLNYSYKSKYLAALTVRRDGYSGFGKDNKYGVFPSAALGWNIQRETFLNDVKAIDILKLRVSYGENGNQAIDPYQTLALMQQENFLGGDDATETAAGYYPSTLSSPTLGWETSKSINVGIDFGLFSNRIYGNIDVYSTNTYDLLLDRTISPIHGIQSITQNIGETKNQGLELYLKTVNISTPDFKWITELTFFTNKNEIVDLYGTGQDDVANGWFIGHSINANYGLVFDGVWQVDEDNSLQPDTEPGDVKIKDTNGDGEITTDDRDFIGQTDPKYTAGLTNSLSYKNFTLSFQIYTEQGVTRENYYLRTDNVTVDARGNTIERHWWTEENPNNIYPANRNGVNPFNIRFYKNASFVRLRDVTLSYNFSNELLNSVGLDKLMIYANIKNGLTFTKWNGLDPEFSDQLGIPISRAFTIGMNIKF